MPNFLITAPDGREFEVTAPEGATQEQALARVQAQYKPQTASAAKPANPFDGAAPAAQQMGEFDKGLNSGVQNMQAMAYGFAGLLGDSVGHAGLRDWGLENYQRNTEEAAKFAPRVGSFRDIENTEDFFDFTAGVLGQTAPFSLTTIAGGGIGGLLTRAIAPSMIAKKIGEKAVEKSVARVLQDKAAKAALTKLVKRGAMTGSFVTSAATQQGGLYGELKEAGVDEAIIPAWIGGSIMGALDIAPEAFLLNKIFAPGKVTKELNESLARSIGGAAKRVGKTAAQQTVLEGVTEGLQETTALLARAASDENFDWDDKANERVLDAVVAGGIAGLFLGGGGGALSELTRKREAEGKKKDEPKPQAAPGAAGQPGAAAAPVAAPPVDGGPGAGGVQPAAVPAGAGAPVSAAPAAPADPVAAPAAPAPVAAAAPAAAEPAAPSPADLQAEVLRRAKEAIAAARANGVASPAAEPDMEAVQQELARREQSTPLEAPSPKEALQTVKLLAANGVRNARVQGSSVIVAPEHQARAAEILANLGTPEAAPTAPAPQVTDNPSAQSARRLAAELSELANKDLPRKGVYVSAASLEHPPVAARIKALERGGQFVVTQNADGKGGVLVSTEKTANEFSQAIAAGEDPEALFGQYTGAATVTPTKPQTDAPLVVQRRDADGVVVQESLIDGTDSDAGTKAVEMVSQQPGEVAVVTPEQALAEREAEVEQEFRHPWLDIKTPREMREFLATDPPFLGDPNAWSAEEAEAYEATGIMFLTWLSGELPGYKKPASYLRKTYEAWHDAKFADRPVMDFDMDGPAYDMPVESSASPPARKFNADQKQLLRSVADQLSQWDTDEAVRLEVLKHLTGNPEVTNSIFMHDQQGREPRELAALAVHMVKGDAAFKSFVATPEAEPDSASGSVTFEELGEREMSRAVLIGKDNVIDTARVPRSKQERAKGVSEEATAMPWKEKIPAERAARMWKAYDRTMDYFVQYVDKGNFRQFGYEQMPAAGAGYYVAAIPTYDADTYYSTLVGANLSTPQLVNLFLMRGKRRWHDVYPKSIKEHDRFDYGIEAVDSKGKKVTIASRDIVDLGYVYDPSLREMRSKNRAKANFHAFVTGVGLIQTSSADLKLTIPQTAREIAGPSGQKDMFDPNMLRGLQVYAWLVLEHRKGGSVQTVAHAIADAMFTKEELAKISEEAAAKLGPKATPDQLYKFAESEKLRYIKAHYSARFGKAVDQANALLKLGVATTRKDRSASKRTITMRKRLAAFSAQLEKARNELRDGRGKLTAAEIERLETRITGLDARLAEYERQQGAAGFDPRGEAAEFSELARDAAELFGLNFLSEQTLAVTDPDEAQGANVDNAENQNGQYMIAETEAAQMARSISGSDFVPNARFAADREGNSAMGTFTPTAPALLGNNPTVAPTVAPAENLTITEELPVSEEYTDAEGRRRLRSTGKTRPVTMSAQEMTAGRAAATGPGAKQISETSALPEAPPAETHSFAPTEPRTRPRREAGFIGGVATRFKDSTRGVTARRIATALRSLLKLDSQLILVDNLDAALDYVDMYGNLFDPREVRAHIEAMIDPTNTGVVFRRKGVAMVYMNPASSELHFLKSIAHEIGHVFYYEKWSQANSVTRMRLTREYEAWLQTDKGKGVVAKRPNYNIDEWIADNVAAWAVTDKKAVSATEKFFEKLAVALKAVHAYMQKHYGGLNETVAEFINETIANREQNRLDPTFDSLGAANDIAFDTNIPPSAAPSHIKRSWDWLRGLRAKYPTLDKWATMLFDAGLALHEKVGARIFMRVKRLGIAAFDEIMSHFYHEVGGDLQGKTAATFFSDANGWLNTFRNRYNFIMKDLDQLAKSKLMNEALQERATPEGFEYAAQLDQLRALLTEVREYAIEAGLPINKVTNYFTQVYDKEALREPGAVDEIMAALNAAGVVDPVTNKPYTLEQVTAIVEGMSDDTYSVDTNPDVKIEDTLGHRAPFAQAMRHRVLPDDVRNAIRTIYDGDGRPKYMAKSIDSVMNTYFAQITNRAEYNRRLGDPDFVEELAKWNALTDEEKMEMNSNGQDLQQPKPVFDPHRKLKLMLERAVSEGAGQAEIDLMYDVISAMLGQYERIENPNLRKLTNGMMLYQNMRTLLFVVLSSIPDLANTFIATGEFKDTFRVMRENAKAALKGELHDTLSMYGYAADALDGSFMREFANWRDGDTSITKWNERFFTAVGLHKWTNFTRALGLKVSMHYVEKHAKLMAEGNEDSTRRMNELGITPDDVQAWIDSGYQTKFGGNTDERIGRVTAAIQRMVDHIQVHPTPPEKTLWGNAETMKLLFHLKGFMYAFSTRVLGRVHHELTRKGATTAQQAAMIGATAMLLPLAAFGLMLRDLFQYWLWGKEAYTPYDDPLAYLGHLAGRSGVTGFGQVAVDVAMASSRGRAPLLAAAGPTVTWVNDWLEYPVHKTLPGSIPIISSVPGIRNELGLWLKGEPAAQ